MWLASSFGAQSDTWKAKGAQFTAELQNSGTPSLESFLNGKENSPSGIAPPLKPSLTNNYLKTLTDLFNSRVSSDGTISRDSLTLSPGTEKLVVDGLVNDAKEHLARTVYKESDITIDNSRSPKDYFNAIGQILEENFSDTENNTRHALLQDFGTYVKRRKVADESYETIQNRMQIQKTKFDLGEKDLHKVHPPQSLATFHVQLLNLYVNSSLAFEQLASFEQDPLLGYVGALNYNKNADAGIIILREMKKIFDKERLIFSEGESGAFLQTLVRAL